MVCYCSPQKNTETYRRSMISDAVRHTGSWKRNTYIHIQYDTVTYQLSLRLPASETHLCDLPACYSTRSDCGILLTDVLKSVLVHFHHVGVCTVLLLSLSHCFTLHTVSHTSQTAKTTGILHWVNRCHMVFVSQEGVNMTLIHMNIFKAVVGV